MPGERNMFLFAEKYVPGRAWAIAMSPPNRQHIDRSMRNEVNLRIRQVLSGGPANGNSAR